MTRSSWQQSGCQACRDGVLSSRWNPPTKVFTSVSSHARLARCRLCGAWWQESEREAHVISEAEARATFSGYFK